MTIVKVRAPLRPYRCGTVPAAPPEIMLPQVPLPLLPPLLPLNLALSRLMRGIVARHPAILRRLGPHATARILLDVTDAPFPLLFEPARLRVSAHRRAALPMADAVIRGKLAAFLAMLHGGVDGDALFFSGALAISGDTAAVLALRNALDDAELDLSEELLALSGRAAPVLQPALALVARRTGLALSRQEGLA